ncbi:MAG: hypothetical protein AAAFM81_07130 [Pseudomonadota bacterium]
MNTGFLEVALESDDILAALAFYRTLGFTELTPNDARDYPYAAITDGFVNIGLHQRAFSAPTLTMMQPELAKAAPNLGDSPYLQSMRIDPDQFHEITLCDADQHTLMLVEARTFSPPTFDPPESLLGRFLEISLPVRNALASAQFWAPYTHSSLGLMGDPPEHLRLGAGHVAIGLCEPLRGRDLQLSYAVSDLAALGHAIDRLGGRLHPCAVGIGACISQVQTPEGLLINLFKEDFLGDNV